MNDSRLYSIGWKAAGQGQASEYELSSQGNSVTEEQIAHQYLAVAQFTGASAYPQVFFTGLSSDIFDQTSSQAAVDTSEWQTYTDLTSYLAGQAITNMDIGLPWSPTTTAAGTLQQTWTPASATRHLLPDRLQRPQPRHPVARPGQRQRHRPRRHPHRLCGAHRHRNRQPCLPVRPGSPPGRRQRNNAVTSATITLIRQSGSPWPNVMRVVAGTATRR